MASATDFQGGNRRRFISAALFAALAPVVAARRVDAGRAWCRTDPVVSIAGDVADIFTSAPLTAPLLVTGPTEIVVTVPEGVPAAVVLTDLGFGKGEVISFQESSKLRATDRGVEVLIKVRVPATDDTMPVRVEFAPRIIGILWPASAEGTANSWVVLRTEL